MRRKDRDMGDAFAKTVFRDCEYAMLATVDKEGMPYCIPISPILCDDVIYFHSATEGQKLENIEFNDKVCISCVSYAKPYPDRFSMQYKSAVVFGRCTFTTERDEKILALRLISEKYAVEKMSNFEEELKKTIDNTTVLKITVEHITGKANL